MDTLLRSSIANNARERVAESMSRKHLLLVRIGRRPGASDQVFRSALPAASAVGSQNWIGDGLGVLKIRGGDREQ